MCHIEAKLCILNSLSIGMTQNNCRTSIFMIIVAGKWKRIKLSKRHGI